MRLRVAEAVPGWRSLLLAALLYGTSCAAKDAPVITSNKFVNSPYDLRYFDDSDVILMQDFNEDAIFRSANAGESWDKVAAIPEGVSASLVMHPFDNTRAYVLTEDVRHFRTEDRGKTWTQFETRSIPDVRQENPLSFHAGNKDKIIVNALDCMLGLYCERTSTYTLDGFQTPAKPLRDNTAGCQWAKGTELFAERESEVDDSRILCITEGKYSRYSKDYKLKISDSFFVDEFEPVLEEGRTVTGVSRIAAVKSYILAASVAEKTDEMALYVTYDTLKWHRAVFPHDHKLVEEAYTILESTNYSIQIDVMTTKKSNPMGVLLSSNSNGTYFTRNVEHTNRNKGGNVDFEKVAAIQGIALVNVVDNWEDVEKSPREAKKIKSQISFDDGRTWRGLKAGEDDLHIHSVTDASNSGRIFSSLAPGIMMGIGNTGKYLKAYDKGDLYVSEDAGVKWKKALEGPHKYEVGDSGSILLAVEDAVTKKMKYSLDRGRKWKEVDLPHKVSPYVLTTTLDSTSPKFLFMASARSADVEEYYIMSINFEDMKKRKCEDKDLEKWYARVNKEGEATCLMGHKQFFMRRKVDADCFMKKDFVDPNPEFEKCDCSDIDYECDFNFVRSEDGKKCVAQGPSLVPDGACKKPDDTFKGSSGWRLIPGNECIPPKEGRKDELVSTPCKDTIAPPASGKVSHTSQSLKGKVLHDHLYFERTETSSGVDETVIAQTDKGVFLSRDHGKNWKEILKDKKVKYVVRHTYLNDRVFFIASDDKVYYSVNRGDDIQEFDVKVPHPADYLHAAPMSFHPTKKDWIIWTGKSCSTGGDSCHAVASISKDRGDSWKTLARYVSKCEFIYAEKTAREAEGEKLIFCGARTKESNDPKDNPWKLVGSTNFFEDSVTHVDDMQDFAIMSEYIIVAAKDNKDELTLKSSVDGKTFANALFPSNFRIPHQHGYTVLDSSTHSIFLHATVDTTTDLEYGGIIKSNSNGTSYVLSLNGVNRDRPGFVDFEKMSQLEGVALANVVTNYETASKDGHKTLKTMITHNDGAEWRYITPPAKDVEGKKFSCSGNLGKCSLNVHGYTERMDKSHIYSSPSAVGIMLAVGNVGESLQPFDKSDTYITRDAGVSWIQVKKGSYMWEYGDQGSIIVLVSDRKETDVVYYSRDEGDTWTEYKFSDSKVRVHDITTLPSDNSRNFLLWVKGDDGVKTINLDFTGLTDRQCVLDETRDENEDYYLWSPRHPTQDDNCLFGHISQYHRKKAGADCYNGHIIEALHDIKSNCTCTRQDFECDYNYQAFAGGECLLVPGLVPVDRIQECHDNPDQIEYYEPTGYRRIPLSTCEGGKEMDRIVAKECPGKEKEFNEKHGLGGFWVFLIVMFSIGAAGSAGWWVYNNWADKFGQIRLGEQCMYSPSFSIFSSISHFRGLSTPAHELTSDTASFDEQTPFIKYPIMAVAGVGAVIIAAPSVASSVWGWLQKTLGGRRGTRFTTRGSFARGADYEAVDEDEGELLGEDSDDEV